MSLEIGFDMLEQKSLTALKRVDIAICIGVKLNCSVVYYSILMLN